VDRNYPIGTLRSQPISDRLAADRWLDSFDSRFSPDPMLTRDHNINTDKRQCSHLNNVSQGLSEKRPAGQTKTYTVSVNADCSHLNNVSQGLTSY